MLLIAETVGISLETVAAFVGIGVIGVSLVGAWWNHSSRITANKESIVRLERWYEDLIQRQLERWDQLNGVIVGLEKKLSDHDAKLNFLVSSAKSNGERAKDQNEQRDKQRNDRA